MFNLSGLLVTFCHTMLENSNGGQGCLSVGQRSLHKHADQKQDLCYPHHGLVRVVISALGVGRLQRQMYHEGSQASLSAQKCTPALATGLHLEYISKY